MLGQWVNPYTYLLHLQFITNLLLSTIFLMSLAMLRTARKLVSLAIMKVALQEESMEVQVVSNMETLAVVTLVVAMLLVASTENLDLSAIKEVHLGEGRIYQNQTKRKKEISKVSHRIILTKNMTIQTTKSTKEKLQSNDSL